MDTLQVHKDGIVAGHVLNRQQQNLRSTPSLTSLSTMALTTTASSLLRASQCYSCRVLFDCVPTDKRTCVLWVYPAAFVAACVPPTHPLSFTVLIIINELTHVRNIKVSILTHLYRLSVISNTRNIIFSWLLFSLVTIAVSALYLVHEREDHMEFCFIGNRGIDYSMTKL